MTVVFKRTSGGDRDFVSLTEELSSFLAEVNGDRNEFFAGHNRVDDIETAVVAYADGRPSACGAFRWAESGVVEIKRMYVVPSARGTGLGARVLEELETWAKELGAGRAILETSQRLAPAVHLYGKSGYLVIDNYGPYVGVSDSVCMAKSLR